MSAEVRRAWHKTIWAVLEEKQLNRVSYKQHTFQWQLIPYWIDVTSQIQWYYQSDKDKLS